MSAILRSALSRSQLARLLLLRWSRGRGDTTVQRVSLFHPNTTLHFRRVPWHLYRDIFVQQCYRSPRPLPAAPRILDIGANIGMASLYFLHRYPDARLTCFEPNPHAFTLLQENIAAMDCPEQNVSLQQAAVSNQDGHLSFAVPRKNLTAAWASVSGRGAAGNAVEDLVVPCVDIRRYLTTPTDLIKLDVEGHEYTILRQPEIQPEAVGALVVEMHDVEQNQEACRALLRDYTRERGYQATDERGQPLDIARFCRLAGSHLVTFVQPDLSSGRLARERRAGSDGEFTAGL